MSKLYCGADKLPKNSKYGTMKECSEKKQVRLYGIRKIDSKTLALSQKESNIPDSRDALIKMMTSLRGEIGRYKGRYETTKETTPEDKIKKLEYYKLWQAADKKLKKVLPKLKKVMEKTDVEKKKIVEAADIKKKMKDSQKKIKELINKEKKALNAENKQIEKDKKIFAKLERDVDNEQMKIQKAIEKKERKENIDFNKKYAKILKERKLKKSK